MKITIWVQRDDLETLYKFLDNQPIHGGKIHWYREKYISLVCVTIDYNDYVRLEDYNSEFQTGVSHGQN